MNLINDLIMLDRQHLQIIEAVSRLGTLTRAAQELCLTQSALSHAMKKLEQQVGTPLWEKDGRKLRLNPAGERVLATARRLLPQFASTEQQLQQIAEGLRGTLRIGMECHPCFQWLQKFIGSFLQKWADVDMDIIQKFQFGGIGALFAHEIDLLVTPDPLHKNGLSFEPVFDYQQMLVVAAGHPLANQPFVTPQQLGEMTLFSYPVETDRLDIFNQFLTPAHCTPQQHKWIETTEIMLQMVAAGRGVAALPGWLVAEYRDKLALTAVQLGPQGLHKQIFLGFRSSDRQVDYLADFLGMARAT